MERWRNVWNRVWINVRRQTNESTDQIDRSDRLTTSQPQVNQGQRTDWLALLAGACSLGPHPQKSKMADEDEVEVEVRGIKRPLVENYSDEEEEEEARRKQGENKIVLALYLDL